MMYALRTWGGGIMLYSFRDGQAGRKDKSHYIYKVHDVMKRNRRDSDEKRLTAGAILG